MSSFSTGSCLRRRSRRIRLRWLWENNIEFWKQLNEVVQAQPPNPQFHNMYGLLAALGMEKGRPFNPDAHMTAILEQAARIGSGQMRVESFGDRRPDRIVWPDRKWEWAALRFEDGDFNTANYADLYARDKWFYQAVGASPAMFKRDTTAGSLYWLGPRDNTGATLDGAKTYKLAVPQPAPGKLFWSVTVYDTATRSQIATDQGKAATLAVRIEGCIEERPNGAIFRATRSIR